MSLAPITDRLEERLMLAQRMNDIAPFHVMEVVNRAIELETRGRNVVHMEIGQPDFGAPAPVIEAAVAAIRQDKMGYTATLGIAPLREAIARFYRDRYGLDVAPERIMITAGASGAFMIALGALINPGDEVLMPDPSYPCNRHFVRIFDGAARGIPVDERQHYQLTRADLEQHWGARTRGVLLASPSNPTGSVIPPSALKEIIEAARARGGWVMVDEIYNGLRYDSVASTALALSDEIFVVNSFSKYFCMTGWRIGWLVAPARHIRAMERLAQNAFICVSAPAQHAALAAFSPESLEILESRRREFQQRRDFLVPALRDLGFRIPLVPEGAFYIYAGCEALCDSSTRFALALLDEEGVAITPGLDFGDHEPERHVRFAYTRALSDLEEGVARIARFLRRG